MRLTESEHQSVYAIASSDSDETALCGMLKYLNSVINYTLLTNMDIDK